MRSRTYRNFQIDQVYTYDSGKADFQYHEIDNPENSGIASSCELADVKDMIDLKLDGKEQVYFVQVTRSWISPINGFIEALEFARFWKGNLIADFKNP